MPQNQHLISHPDWNPAGNGVDDILDRLIAEQKRPIVGCGPFGVVLETAALLLQALRSLLERGGCRRKRLHNWVAVSGFLQKSWQELSLKSPILPQSFALSGSFPIKLMRVPKPVIEILTNWQGPEKSQIIVLFMPLGAVMTPRTFDPFSLTNLTFEPP